MNIEVIKSRRKSISIEITKELKVIVRAPLLMRNKDIQAFINCKAGWIDKNLHIMENRIKNQQITTNFTEEEIKVLTTKAKKIIPDQVEYYACIIGVKYNRITIKHQATRWGSCSAKGNLNFNCLLVLCPPEVCDYVIIHELCHLKELNHSPRFWAEVEKYCPNYKTHKQWLKDNGTELIKRLGG